MDGKRPTVASLHGMAAAAHPLAAQAGARLLGQGGNAFDAAVATAAALNVVEPYNSGLAGRGMATCYVAAERRIRALDFRTRVPKQFPVGRFSRRADLERGPFAAGVPGNLAGWCELIGTYGRTTLAAVLAPAIALARDGFPLTEFNARAISNQAVALKAQPDFVEWSRVYTDCTGAVRVGQVLHQPDLARTLEAVAANGPAHLYGGPLGRALVAHLQALGGCMTLADLTTAQPVWADPIAGAYHDLLVHTLPPPCQGFQYLLTLRILDGLDLGSLERDGVAHLDTVWRAIRLAAGERIAHDNPPPDVLASLLAEPSVAALRDRVADGVPVEGQTEQWLAPPKDVANPQHTTSFSITDADGNMICLTQSLGSGFGCGVMVPGTGVCLNNSLYWGELDPRGPNALLPGRTLTSPMAPSIATREGNPVLALGTPGSHGICQTQAQAMVQFVDFGLPLQDAIDAPRARLFDGRKVQVESRIPAETLDSLRARGHDVEELPPWTMVVGGMQAISVDPATGAMTGAADSRRDSYVSTP
ncbi:MAG TPA: gamma-glutamyltransferase [Acetobacteraceae bacterium]|jgi:gamma-glutamyltranspeptidase/glutathione hydrolase|nr:gamma-glutamyltransferase [Acetobacteraceae bacterium]